MLALFGLVSCDKRPDGPGERPPPVVEPPADPGSVEPGDRDRSPPLPPDPTAGRAAVVGKNHPLYARVEAPEVVNACAADRDCYVGGCSGEVCSAEQEIMSDCSVVERPGWPDDAACGCVAGQCAWWSAGGTTLGRAGGGDAKAPAADSCGDKPCTPPQTCVEYYGIAGPRGPKFSSCEIRCKGGKVGRADGKPMCPDGMQCVTIADGPGSVCRPTNP